MEVGDFKRAGGLEAWCTFGDDGEVLIRYVAVKEMATIEKKATSRTFKRGAMQEDININQHARLFGQAAVKGWKNLTSGGKELPFTEENLDMLMEKSFDFRAFVNDKATEISNFNAEDVEEAVGKSVGTPTTG